MKETIVNALIVLVFLSVAWVMLEDGASACETRCDKAAARFERCRAEHNFAKDCYAQKAEYRYWCITKPR